MGSGLKVRTADGDAHAAAAPPVRAHARADAVAKGKKDAPGLLLGGHVFLQRHRVSVALDRLRLGQNRAWVDAVRMVMEHPRILRADKTLQLGKLHARQHADGKNAGAFQPLRGFFADAKQLAHRQRPELFRNLLRKKRVHAVWLFKIARHFRQQLIGRDADIDREAEL